MHTVYWCGSGLCGGNRADLVANEDEFCSFTGILQTLKFIRPILLAVAIVIPALTFHLSNLDQLPLGHHAWTQIDHYAISLGFQDNGFDFFHPQTFAFSTELVNGENVPSHSSITAVDFPIHQYVVALLMEILNTNSVLIPRIYILLWSFLGLFFLGEMVFLLTKRTEAAVLIVVLAATAPLFVYFQTAIMPTIPSMASAIIGLYFWIRYLISPRKRLYVFAISFLTLAALTRTTFLIPLLAIAGCELWLYLRNRSIPAFKIISFTAAAICIGGYYGYNNFLRAEYGSIFLSSFMPPENLREAGTLLWDIMDRWGFHFFAELHYLVMIGIVVLAILNIIRNKTRLNPVHKQVLIFTAISLMGCILFAVLMMKQFYNHDYYFLDSFFIPVLMLTTLGLAVIRLPASKFSRPFSFALIASLSIPLILTARQSNIDLQQKGWWNRTSATAQNFEGSDEFLCHMGVPEDAVILVPDAYAPNLPFILMNRKGHPLINSSTRFLTSGLDWKWDYAVIQNEFFFSDIYRNYPPILNQMEFIGTNGKISVYRKSTTRQSLDAFLGINDVTPLYFTGFSTDSVVSEEWSLTESWNDPSGTIHSEFPVSWSISLDEFIGTDSLLLFFQLTGLALENQAVKLVLKLNQQGETIFYREYTQYTIKENPVTAMNLWMPLPIIAGKEKELQIYLWNPGEGSVEINSGSVSIYTFDEVISFNVKTEICNPHAG